MCVQGLGAIGGQLKSKLICPKKKRNHTNETITKKPLIYDGARQSMWNFIISTCIIGAGANEQTTTIEHEIKNKLLILFTDYKMIWTVLSHFHYLSTSFRVVSRVWYLLIWLVAAAAKTERAKFWPHLLCAESFNSRVSSVHTMRSHKLAAHVQFTLSSCVRSIQFSFQWYQHLFVSINILIKSSL